MTKDLGKYIFRSVECICVTVLILVGFILTKNANFFWLILLYFCI
jgi:hypothetical protein